jgi:hypothetical protein
MNSPEPGGPAPRASRRSGSFGADEAGWAVEMRGEVWRYFWRPASRRFLVRFPDRVAGWGSSERRPCHSLRHCPSAFELTAAWFTEFGMGRITVEQVHVGGRQLSSSCGGARRDERPFRLSQHLCLSTGIGAVSRGCLYFFE